MKRKIGVHPFITLGLFISSTILCLYGASIEGTMLLCAAVYALGNPPR